MRNNKKYIIVDTNKSGVRFRNSALLDLNSEYMRVRDRYTEHQKAVVTEIIKIAGKMMKQHSTVFCNDERKAWKREIK